MNIIALSNQKFREAQDQFDNRHFDDAAVLFNEAGGLQKEYLTQSVLEKGFQPTQFVVLQSAVSLIIRGQNFKAANALADTYRGDASKISMENEIDELKKNINGRSLSDQAILTLGASDPVESRFKEFMRGYIPADNVENLKKRLANGESVKAFICGPKGVGKSSAINYLNNNKALHVGSYGSLFDLLKGILSYFDFPVDFVEENELNAIEMYAKSFNPSSTIRVCAKTPPVLEEFANSGLSLFLDEMPDKMPPDFDSFFSRFFSEWKGTLVVEGNGASKLKYNGFETIKLSPLSYEDIDSAILQAKIELDLGKYKETLENLKDKAFYPRDIVTSTSAFKVNGFLTVPRLKKMWEDAFEQNSSFGYTMINDLWETKEWGGVARWLNLAGGGGTGEKNIYCLSEGWKKVNLNGNGGASPLNAAEAGLIDLSFLNLYGKEEKTLNSEIRSRSDQKELNKDFQTWLTIEGKAIDEGVRFHYSNDVFQKIPKSYFHGSRPSPSPQKAHKAFKEGRFKEAEESFLELSFLNPDKPVNSAMASFSIINQKEKLTPERYYLAYSLTKRAVSHPLEKNPTATWNKFGHYLEVKREFRRAFNIYNEGIDATDGKAPELWNSLGLLYENNNFKGKDYTKAENTFKEGIKATEGKDAGLWNSLGLIYENDDFEGKDYTKAENIFREGIKTVEGKAYELLTSLITFLILQDRFEEAENEFNKCKNILVSQKSKRGLKAIAREYRWKAKVLKNKDTALSEKLISLAKSIESL